MSTCIYVLSDSSNPTDKYKVGFHDGDYHGIVTRYITAIPELNIHYIIKASKAFEIESMFKKLYKAKRILNIRGNLSEWYMMSLDNILKYLLQLVSQYDKLIDPDILQLDKLYLLGIRMTKTPKTNDEKEYIKLYNRIKQSQSRSDKAPNNILNETNINEKIKIEQPQIITSKKSNPNKYTEERCKQLNDTDEMRLQELQAMGVKMTRNPTTQKEEEYRKL